ncbi:MAG: pyruvate/ketoisovalerate ferredoxin oxidoreductase subunit gamma [Myxococcota bacterium]
MLQLRFHGRGGQGAVTSAELLALAAIREGKYAQAFPSFGPERRGAPVMAFARIDEKPIRDRTKVANPDVVIVLDSSILRTVDITQGLHDESIIIIASPKEGKELKKELGFKYKTYVVNAKHIAIEEMKVAITNTTMLGAFLAAKEVVSLETIEEVIRERFGKIAEGNIRALKRAKKETKAY